MSVDADCFSQCLSDPSSTYRRQCCSSRVQFPACQCCFSAIKYWFVRSSKLSFCVNYCRELANVFTFYVYARIAAETLGRPAIVKRVVNPGAALLALYLSVLLVLALGSSSLDHYCGDSDGPLVWFMMSISAVVTTISLLVVGSVMIVQINRAANTAAQYTELVSGGQHQLTMRRKQLYTLLVVNAVGSVVQMSYGAYVQSRSAGDGAGSQGSDCHPAGTSGEAETEMIKLLFNMLSYSVPVWAALYVFYWVPRHQYQKNLDLILSNYKAELDERDALEEW